MPLTSGETLNDRYRIVKLLGQGGFGAVYRAWDTKLNGPCALKENFDVSSAAQSQFLREASMLFNLRHPNLPRVFDSFTIQGQGQYLVMDYIEGKDLAQIVEESSAPLSEAQALDWIGQVCDALEYLHNQNPPVVHRDLKPANIRITSKGQAILVDFGIAKIYDPNLKTTMGARAVTQGYSPPEQYGIGITDPQSDVYALGATLFNMLTLVDPPPSVDIVAGNLEPPAPVHTLNPAVSPAVSEAIAKAMQLHRSARYKTVAEFKKALTDKQSTTAVEHTTVSIGYPAATSKQPGVAAQAPLSGVSIPAVSAHVLPAAPSLQAQPRVQPSKLRIQRPVVLGLGALALLFAVVVVIAAFSLLSGGGNDRATQTELAQALEQATEEIKPTSVIPTATLAIVTTDTPIPPSATPTQTETLVQLSMPTNTPTGLPDQFTDEKGVTMILVPNGEFTMGDENGYRRKRVQGIVQQLSGTPSSFANAEPVLKVYLDDYYLDRTEVTNALYEACVQAGACTPPAENSSSTRSSYYGNADYADYPVIHVDWNQAQAYCEWRGADLPTEAQWEKGSRGVDGRLYPWGFAFDGSKTNFCDSNCTYDWAFSEWDDGFGDTAPVGSYPEGASPYGLLDMAGNVWEWVKDWYLDSFYTSSPLENPVGPASGEARSIFAAVRGAILAALFARPFVTGTSGQGIFFGFRCARLP